MEERNSHINELIAAFLSKGLSKEAREELDAWIASSEENRRYFMQQQEIWFSADRRKNVRATMPTALLKPSGNGWLQVRLRSNLRKA